MAPPQTEVADIKLQPTTHLSTPKGWKAESAWLADLQRTVYPHKLSCRAQDSESCRSKTNILTLCHATIYCFHGSLDKWVKALFMLKKKCCCQRCVSDVTVNDCSTGCRVTSQFKSPLHLSTLHNHRLYRRTLKTFLFIMSTKSTSALHCYSLHHN